MKDTPDNYKLQKVLNGRGMTVHIVSSSFLQFAAVFREMYVTQEGCQASQRKGLTSREVRGTSGEVWETSGALLDCPAVTLTFAL